MVSPIISVYKLGTINSSWCLGQWTEGSIKMMIEDGRKTTLWKYIDYSSSYLWCKSIVLFLFFRRVDNIRSIEQVGE